MEMELRQLRKANAANVPKRADLVWAAMQDMVVVKSDSDQNTKKQSLNPIINHLVYL
jgi:hypothetical protein